MIARVMAFIFVGVCLIAMCEIIAAASHDNDRRQSVLGEVSSGSSVDVNLNETDNASWLAEYESDGEEGAPSVSMKRMSIGKIALPMLILFMSGIMAAVAGGRCQLKKIQIPDE